MRIGQLAQLNEVAQRAPIFLIPHRIFMDSFI